MLSTAKPLPTSLSVSWNSCYMMTAYISITTIPARPFKIIGLLPHSSVKHLVVIAFEVKATVP